MKTMASAAVLVAVWVTGPSFADAVSCVDVPGSTIECDGGLLGEQIYIGVRTDTTPDRVEICEINSGLTEIVDPSAPNGWLAQDLILSGGGGSDYIVVVRPGSPSVGCGHTYAPMNLGNRWMNVHADDGNDVVTGAPGQIILYGDAGNDQLFSYAEFFPAYGGSGYDLLKTYYAGATSEDIDGGSDCDCLEVMDAGDRADFFCGSGFADQYQAKAFGTLNSCEYAVAQCGGGVFGFECPLG